MLSKINQTVLRYHLNAHKNLYMKNIRAFSSQNNNQQNTEGEQNTNGGRQTEGESEYQETTTQKTTSFARQVFRLGWWTFVGLFSYNYYLASTSQNPEKETGYVAPVFALSTKVQKKVQDVIDFFTKPPAQNLLVDQHLVYGFGPAPKTLVLNLTGTIVHTEFKFGKGTQIKKRPGLNEFLNRLSEHYEIVILADEDSFFVDEVRQHLDPNQRIFFNGFGKEAMVFEGKYYKDLSYLNRDLKRIVVVDWNEDYYKKHIDNAIILDKYTGNQDDQLLKETLPLLLRLANPNIKDVRQELSKYGHHNPGKAFVAEMQTKVDALKQRQQKGFGGFILGGSNQQAYPQYAKKDNY
ncbi:NLI interacting factor-like phosphatase (macronuclear) [Tetrahymena thermophila SB210]|uniref:Mitochondrial import inner membrane translocase subunit TIM50 n=1 Tax=Tetrahymena thermophila (strain SB210) TaxID=312017 RepID=I7M3E4_TETTS|nr:NLI interacting factor-like phosphatase [Tetrahymena thermophila SB210]EAS02988.2 NLI interacting factor-like phosphatase [Tetrahymena thermophila SB210]|eukprot:XP_001023233.2 NLI interacting factor-like phosphatase [Tetrahymena thermophila SB210]